MLAIVYLLCGLVAAVVGVAGLAGVWWALVVLGAALVVLGVLEARGAAEVVVVETGDGEGP